ncbi:MAG TPA: WecB/TagA/CpsF family glycosyltransferase [Patescibacteria group bacterium]
MSNLVKILGVRIDNLSKKEILEKIENFLGEEKFHQIATVNPEFILKAQENQEFKSILKQCDLNIADGIGLKYAFLRYGQWLKVRIAGVDLMHEILRLANKKRQRVFLATDKRCLSSFDEIAGVLQKEYSQIAFQNSPTDADIAFCSYGAPEQELFLKSLKNDKLRLAMGIGGSFDYITGKKTRAPKFFRMLGLEWLWRLGAEPKYRSKRIFQAVVVFPFRILINR